MSDYPETARAAMNLADAIATDTSTVRRGEAKGLSQQQIRDLAERITNIDAPEDDEIPPEPPDGFMVAQGMRLLIVSWAEPPETDYVVEARVRTYRESNGELVLTQFVRGRSVTVPNLDPYQPDGATREGYNVEVALTDMWGRQGEAATTGPHEPLLSASDEVDLQKLAQLERLRGLLPNTNLATLEDALLLGDQIVQARSMTSMDAAAINLWVQNAAIEAAKVKEMTVDKLVGGMISTTTISVASRLDLIGSGVLNAGKLEISAGGIKLGEVSSSIGFPSNSPASFLTMKDTPNVLPSPGAGLGFFMNAQVRGIGINADGQAGTSREGLVRLCATSGTQQNDALSTAILTVNSQPGGGFLGLKEDVVVNRHVNTSTGDIVSGRHVQALGRIFPGAELQANVGGGGGIFMLNHSRGTEARLYSCCYRDPNGNWREFVDQVAGFNVVLTDNAIRVVNNNSAALTVKIAYYG